jgi:hypothetical protein
MDMGHLAFLSGYSKEGMVVRRRLREWQESIAPGGTCFGQDEGAGLTGRLHQHCFTLKR